MAIRRFQESNFMVVHRGMQMFLLPERREACQLLLHGWHHDVKKSMMKSHKSSSLGNPLKLYLYWCFLQGSWTRETMTTVNGPCQDSIESQLIYPAREINFGCHAEGHNRESNRFCLIVWKIQFCIKNQLIQGDSMMTCWSERIQTILLSFSDVRQKRSKCFLDRKKRILTWDSGLPPPPVVDRYPKTGSGDVDALLIWFLKPQTCDLGFVWSSNEMIGARELLIFSAPRAKCFVFTSSQREGRKENQ